jgi:hypothetical protein
VLLVLLPSSSAAAASPLVRPRFRRELLPELEVEVEPCPLDCRGERAEEVRLLMGAARVMVRRRVMGVRMVRCMTCAEWCAESRGGEV